MKPYKVTPCSKIAEIIPFGEFTTSSLHARSGLTMTRSALDARLKYLSGYNLLIFDNSRPRKWKLNATRNNLIKKCKQIDDDRGRA